ncbi:MAG: hypothetical protein ACR2NZ_04910 [Rubripirellula sp.]
MLREESLDFAPDFTSGRGRDHGPSLVGFDGAGIWPRGIRVGILTTKIRGNQ